MTKPIAVISNRKTMAIIFEESNLPEWANRMLKVKLGGKVNLSDREGIVTDIHYDTNGAVIAKVKTENTENEIEILSL